VLVGPSPPLVLVKPLPRTQPPAVRECVEPLEFQAGPRAVRARAPSPLRGGLVVAGLASAARRREQHSVKLCKEEV